MVWVVILVIIVFGFCMSNRKVNDFLLDYEFVAVILISLSLIFVLAMFITIPVNYFSSMETVAEMQAFVGEVKDCYEYTVDETKELTITIPNIETDSTVDLNALIYMGLAGNVSERLKELRDKVIEHNENYRKFIIFNNNFFTDCFYYELPDDILPINLKLKSN